MNNADKIILHLCADIGSDSEQYKNAGYNVICIGQKIGVENYHPPKNVYGVIANPPCTMFSLARTRAKTPRDFRQGMECVKHCMRIIWECRYEPLYYKDGCLKFWVLENPSGFLRQFLGKPAMTYHPFEFGERYTKSTDLWGFFNEPKRNPVKLTDEELALCKINNRKLPPIPSILMLIGSKQAAKRAICPKGFSKAFFEANQ